METKILEIDPKDYRLADLGEPAEVLKGGGLVAFPTETVYGIAANAHDPAALDKLVRVKDRPASKSFSLHVAAKDEVPKHVDRVPPIARTLMDRFWPGPLTIIFPGAGEQGVGIRFPANRLAQDLIRLSGVPIVMPSANVSGDDAPGEPGPVREAFDGKIEMIVDAGPCQLREASTVVRVDDGSWEVLREGIITAEMIRNLVCTTVLFVCSGNSCRSPMAEGLLKKALADRLGVPVEDLLGQGYRVLSAGTGAMRGGRASSASVQVMEERGIDIREHAAQPVTRDLADSADLIYALGHNHALILEEWMPEIRERVHLLDPDGIEDPIGMPVEHYRACANQIEARMDSVIEAVEALRSRATDALPEGDA